MFGFYDRLGSIEGYDNVRLPQEKFASPTGEPYIAAMTYGEDGRFILNFATQSADMASVFHEGSHAIVDTARRLYEMGVFEGYETILTDEDYDCRLQRMDNSQRQGMMTLPTACSSGSLM